MLDSTSFEIRGNVSPARRRPAVWSKEAQWAKHKDSPKFIHVWGYDKKILSLTKVPDSRCPTFVISLRIPVEAECEVSAIGQTRRERNGQKLQVRADFDKSHEASQGFSLAESDKNGIKAATASRCLLLLHSHQFRETLPAKNLL